MCQKVFGEKSATACGFVKHVVYESPYIISIPDNMEGLVMLSTDDVSYLLLGLGLVRKSSVHLVLMVNRRTGSMFLPSFVWLQPIVMVSDEVVLLAVCSSLCLFLADHEAVFAASLANSQLVLQPFAGSRNVVVTVQDMLDHDRTLMALGTLMYAPVSIEDAMSRRGEVWSVDAHQLRRALAAYPKIQAAVFPDHSSDNKTAAELQDVSLYELLQVGVYLPLDGYGVCFHGFFFQSSEACDVSRLFRWQSTNNLDTDDESQF